MLRNLIHRLLNQTPRFLEIGRICLRIFCRPCCFFGKIPTSADRAQGQEIQSSGAVLWVADENAATDLADQGSDLAPAVNIPEEVLAEVVSRDLGQGEEEDQNRPAVPSILSEQV